MKGLKILFISGSYSMEYLAPTELNSLIFLIPLFLLFFILIVLSLNTSRDLKEIHSKRMSNYNPIIFEDNLEKLYKDGVMNGKGSFSNGEFDYKKSKKY